MIASRQDGEITFYEELGVAPDASPEAIRDAFRLYVRLLHPDNQTDPQLKEIAENQMRKFNRIYAVLSDQESRRHYDEILDEDYSPPIILTSPSSNLTHLAARLTWVAAIIASAGLLFWLASDNTPAVLSHTPEANGALAQAAASPSPSPAPQILQLQSDVKTLTVERDAAIRELKELRGTPPGGGMDPKQALTLTELPSASDH